MSDKQLSLAPGSLVIWKRAVTYSTPDIPAEQIQIDLQVHLGCTKCIKFDMSKMEDQSVSG